MVVYEKAKQGRSRYALQTPGLAGIGAGLFLGCSSALAFDADALPPVAQIEIERIDCPFTPPLGETPICLMADLPMRHADLEPDGSLPEDAPRIGVHVTVLNNLSSSESPNPVVFLSGGPGQAGSQAIGGFGYALELRRNRAIVLVDQRGTGLSQPRLDCAEVSPSELDGNPFNDPDFDPDMAVNERFSACHDIYLDKEIDLSAFDTRSAALDLRAIRQALDLPQWNLMGTSYGGRLALDAMRVDPEGVRAAVLNSPLSLAPQTEASTAAERPRIFRQLFDDCAQDAFCTEAYGDLEEKFSTLAAHFEDGPMQLQFRDPQSGELVRREVNWTNVVEVLYQHLAFSDSAMQVPRFIAELHDVARGRLSLNDDEVARIFGGTIDAIVDTLALGQHLSVKCREDYPITDTASLTATMQEDPVFFPDEDPFRMYRLNCPVWDVGSAPAEFSAPLHSDIPTLILSGDADTLTPHVMAQNIAATLPNGQLVSFRGIGHDVHSSLLCGRSLVANFLDAPDQPVDQSCVGDIKPRFE
jgi:pimeloyl-ACP methyl ester carboxylesterase